ncbi:WD40 repeat domain-containing protein [uncultured Oscillibacter sp.]|uniref:WD40 repeat domain-containing protein n=1 Tax=uncultured Oscillibacter sp. TaxID=876091 RepID=UPI00260BC5B5|nr:WD40 repeat domain-containing protein [uncultured Oscillibacter sp.]
MKKTFYITLALLFTLALSACGKADSPAPAVSGSNSSNTPVVSVPDAGSQQGQPPSSCTFAPALFGGKLQSCAYAGNGTLLVLADKLYLYDTGTSSVLATAEAPLRDFEAQAIDGGYVLSGMGDGGMMAYIYDRSLSLKKEIAVNELLAGDFVVSETGGVAASTEGKKLAFAAMGGLYLYDLESGSLTTLLDLSQNAGTASIGISMLNGAAFAQGNSQIVFYGSGNSIPAVDGEDSFSIYGSIAVDGSGLKITKPSDYAMEEMQSSTSRLFFPQTFTRANGTLLWVDRATGSANTLSFSASGEGKDGVYGSEQGNYVATAVLGSDLTVRVYDVASGELVATEVIENSDPTYFNRIPRIYLLDGAKTAVVVLGGSISELDTLVSTFEFGA